MQLPNRRTPTICAALLGVALLSPVPLAAQAPRYDSRTDRLAGLTKADLARLEPYMALGPVALVEFADTEGDELPGINLATLIDASTEQVVAILSRPERYPGFMKTLDSVELVSRRGPSIVYDWKWGMSLFELSGRNAMTFYSPPPGRESSGHRITVDSQSGDLGTGRMVIRVLPRGAHRCLVVLSMRLDLRRANYIARQLARAARSINRSANMSLTYSMLLSLRKEAERVGGHVRKPQPGPPEKPAVDIATIWPLLGRGDVVILQMNGEELAQIAVYGVIGKKNELVREVMLDANAFGSALMPGSEAAVVAKDAATTTFDWDIDLPLVGVSGRMRMRDQAPAVTIDAIDGALEGGRWSFETREVAKDLTLVTGLASFDIRKTSWLLRSLATTDPYLGQGMSAASEVMLVRALRSRTRKRAEQAAVARAAKE